MLSTLKEYQDAGFPQEMLMNFCSYRIEYLKMPLSDRLVIDFGYFMRCKLIEYLRNNKARYGYRV